MNTGSEAGIFVIDLAGKTGGKSAYVVWVDITACPSCQGASP